MTWLIFTSHYVAGVTAEDYIVIINGVRAEPISVSETRLKVRWPESKPFGVTTVSTVLARDINADHVRSFL